MRFLICLGLTLAVLAAMENEAADRGDKVGLARVSIATNGMGFLIGKDKPFVPFGVNYFRPNTGWAPQLWKRFDAQATRKDLKVMKGLGVNCVRVFLTYGSFYMEPGKLDLAGLEKFDQFLAMAEAEGIYVHPTGPDHWEGLPDWAKGDRIADDRVLAALEDFWRLFASRYRERNVLFAYDLLNEPEVRWDSPSLLAKWRAWVGKRHGNFERAAEFWGLKADAQELAKPPSPANAPGDRRLLDYQLFREDIAEEWTRRQVVAIRKADPAALVTVGLIQWSVPSLLPGIKHYSAFRPGRHAPHLDFMEVHFYPFDPRVYDYAQGEEETNLAYLNGVVREAARYGKPVVLAEFGWYGGGKPRFDGGKHPSATEEQQARWCRQVVVTTAGLVQGWLNWGLYDQPEATDVSEFTGLLTAEGNIKAWGEEFRRLAKELPPKPIPGILGTGWPPLPWTQATVSTEVGDQYRRQYFQILTNRVKLEQ